MGYIAVIIEMRMAKSGDLAATLDLLGGSPSAQANLTFLKIQDREAYLRLPRAFSHTLLLR
jgi:hypothetical protein